MVFRPALAMNVLRMIKLFGWEPKINERVAEKRDDELRWIRRRQLLNLLNGNMKFVRTIIWSSPGVDISSPPAISFRPSR